MTCTSDDFLTWTDPVWLEYVEGTPNEHLYTNQITAYPRAPHILMGFPKRFLPGRRPAGNRMPGLSDGVFMTSRDGLLFSRWQEALIRPGPQAERWVNRNNMTAWGIVETASAIPGCPSELSIYSTEGYYRGDSCQIRRFSLRLDGFVSLNAPMAGGMALTKPLTFALPPANTAEAPAVANSAPVNVTTDTPLRGNASLKVREPVFFRLPNTKELGNKVTFSVTTRGIPPGHRRLFSAYNGGAIKTGCKELIFDLFSGGCFKVDGVSLRFNYDDVKVFVKKTDLTDWEAVSAGKRPVCFTATWDDGVVRVFLDGKLVGEGGKPGRGDIDLKLGDLHFGEDHKGTSVQNEPFLGTADDIVVLRRVLTDADVARLAADGAAAVLTPAEDHGIWYSMEAPDLTNLTDRLTGDGAADAALPIWGSTRPGDCQLLLNYATSAAGSIRCEIIDSEGNALPGYTMEDCDEIYGDHIERPVAWNTITELRHLAGTPIQIRFELKDADLYAIRFGRPQARDK